MNGRSIMVLINGAQIGIKGLSIKTGTIAAPFGKYFAHYVIKNKIIIHNDLSPEDSKKIEDLFLIPQFQIWIAAEYSIQNVFLEAILYQDGIYDSLV